MTFDADGFKVWLEIAGMAGFVVYVCNYFALSSGYFHADQRRYFVFNLCAASLVLIGLAGAFNLPAALIQGFWIALSAFAILVRSRTSLREAPQPVFRSARNRPFYPLAAAPSEPAHHRLDRRDPVRVRRVRAQKAVARIGYPKEELRPA